MFIDNSLIDLLAEQSNIYSLQLTSSSINLTLKEIEKFIGVYFRMGLVKMPSIRSYWELKLHMMVAVQFCPKNGFLSILRNLLFVDNLGVNDETENNDRCWKIRQWLGKLRENILVVSPEELYPFNEIMVAFKGRSLLKQYLPNNPNNGEFMLCGRSGNTVF